MSHYFETPAAPGQTHRYWAHLWGRRVKLTSSDGVFSAHRLDLGTATLLHLTQPPPADQPLRLLDLGCGAGAIGIALALACPQASIDAIDINQQAIDLTNLNAKDLGVGDRLIATTADAIPSTRRYDQIWSNPPIRIGKPALHQLLNAWLTRLTDSGVANLVVAKNLGSDSLQNWLIEAGWLVTRLGSSKGYRVLSVRRPFDCTTEPGFQDQLPNH
ncbi:MAG: methyltransferase [Propionibacteriaceae bacterium]|jgi:16S rRNA G1207 methylase RsmC|nr:methyltransferase [Propionibacteriaceae bacterium]